MALPKPDTSHIYADPSVSGVCITFDCGETNNYLSRSQAEALIRKIRAAINASRALQARRTRQLNVLDRCVTGVRS